MAFSTGNIIRATSFYRRGSIEAVNVAYWRIEAMDGVAVDAAWAAVYQYGLMTVARVQEIMPPVAVCYRVLLDNLTNVGEYGEWVEDVPGVASGDVLPPFNAASIKQIVPTRETRAGYKRIPFIAEPLNDGGNLNISSIVRSSLEAFFGSAGNTIIYSPPGFDELELTLQPIVVGRTLVDGVYELDLTKIQDVSSAVVQAAITTQNSRKS